MESVHSHVVICEMANLIAQRSAERTEKCHGRDWEAEIPRPVPILFFDPFVNILV